MKGEDCWCGQRFSWRFTWQNPWLLIVMSTWKQAYELMAVKLNSRQANHTWLPLKNYGMQTYPESVYEYQFLDEKIADFYKQENQLSQLYKIFAGIAIFISCLGLYGLVSFMATQRTKEIGDTKSFGCLRSEYCLPVLQRIHHCLICISFLIAAPLAYYFMHGWLENFTFRISIGAEHFHHYHCRHLFPSHG